MLFFIEIGSRKVHLGGVTTNLNAAWVTQQARNLVGQWSPFGFRFLIRDRDSKYTWAFDEVFRSEAARSSALRSRPRSLTPSRNALSARCGVSAWTAYSSSGRRHLEWVFIVYAYFENYSF